MKQTLNKTSFMQIVNANSMVQHEIQIKNGIVLYGVFWRKRGRAFPNFEPVKNS